MRCSPAFLFAVALVGAACSPRTEGDPAHTASAYTSHSDTEAAKYGLEGTTAGRELQAPAKIPAMRIVIANLDSESLDHFNANIPAQKGELSVLVQAMKADLSRLGVPESPEFKALGDSVLADVGGGVGGARKLSESERREHLARVSRLIRVYENATHRAPP